MRSENSEIKEPSPENLLLEIGKVLNDAGVSKDEALITLRIVTPRDFLDDNG